MIVKIKRDQILKTIITTLASIVLILTILTSNSQSQSDINPNTFSAVDIPPAQIDRAIQRIDELAISAMETTKVPGIAIAVVRDDRLVYAKGFGVKQVGGTDKVDENTVFQIASISKPIGATVVAGVVGDGTVNWNDRVTQYLPNFALADDYVTNNVTLADFYCHRSGLPAHAGDLLEDIGYDRTQVLSRLKYLPLNPFRAVYNYTNFGITTAAEAVAKASKSSWSELSRYRLYDRLGMSSTSSTYADFIDRENKALGNVVVEGKWIPTPQQRQSDTQSPAGGVSSNVVDMSKWMRMVLNEGMFEKEQVINTNSLLEALTPHMTTSATKSIADRASFYGLGFGVNIDGTGRTRFSHSGAFFLGTATTMAMLPSENLGIVVLTNGMPIGVPESIVASFMDLVETGSLQFDWLALYRPLFEQMFVNHSILANKQFPANPVKVKANEDYVGIYDNDYYGEAKVVVSPAGKLILEIGPNSQRFPLLHWNDRTFAFYPRGENALGISAVTFNLSEDRVTSMTIEFFDEYNMGTFKRQK